MTKRFQLFINHPKKPVAFICIITSLLYIKTLAFGFTSMDEQWMIVNNVPFLSHWSSLIQAFTEATTDSYYRPLFMVSLILDYHLGKLSPLIYHLTNLCWHLAAIYLLFWLFSLLEINRTKSFISILLFAIHPALVQAVAWVPGRNDLMLCVFILLSLINLIKFIKTKKSTYLILHFIFFVCSLLTKESAILLPLIYVVLYFIYNSKPSKLMFPLIIWPLIGCAWYLVRMAIVKIPLQINLDLNVLKEMLMAYLLFLGKVMLPFQQSIMPTITDTSFWFGLLTLVFILFLVFKIELENKKLAFLGLWLFVVLLLIPIWFGVTKAGIEHYEQRIYSSLTGILLFFTQLKFNLNSKMFSYLIIIVCLFYLAKTYHRLSVYKNELTYINTGIDECPNHYLFYLQKADLLAKQSNYSEAIPLYNKAISLRPNYAQALSNRGMAYLNTRAYTKAIVDFSEAIKAGGFNELFYVNRCLALYKNRDFENAMKDLIILKKCCHESIPPDLEKELMKHWIEQMDGLMKQLYKERNNAELFYKISKMYFDIEMESEAEKYIHQALMLDPNNETYVEFKKRMDSK